MDSMDNKDNQDTKDNKEKRPSAAALAAAYETLPCNDLLYGDFDKSVQKKELAAALTAAYKVDFPDTDESLESVKYSIQEIENIVQATRKGQWYSEKCADCSYKIFAKNDLGQEFLIANIEDVNYYNGYLLRHSKDFIIYLLKIVKKYLNT